MPGGLLKKTFADTASDTEPLISSASESLGDVLDEGSSKAASAVTAVENTDSGVLDTVNRAAGRLGDAEQSGVQAVADDGTKAASSALHKKFADVFASDGAESTSEARTITATGADDPLEADSPKAAAAYEPIRARTDDTTRIAENTGYDEGLLDRVKGHVFMEEHDVAVGPGQSVRGRFAPQDDAGRLWEKATRGPLSGDDADLFGGWLAHEGVESSLMRDGLPYRSEDPSTWVKEFDDDDSLTNTPNPEHFGAHDLAPNAWDYKRPFKQWSLLGLPKPEISIAPDLSNLDDVVGLIRGSMG